MTQYQYRLLNNHDLNEFKKFYDIFSSNAEYVWSLNLALQALTENTPEVFVAAEIDNSEIISIMLGFSANTILDKFLFQKNYLLLPFWILGLWVSKKNVSQLYHERGDKLSILISDCFLNLGMESFYVARKVKSNINYNNALEYIKRFNRVSIYEPCIEKIFYSENYNPKTLNILYKILCHPTCEKNKCVVIIKYILKPQFRLT